jgi:GT2 family glycosyltransferase
MENCDDVRPPGKRRLAISVAICTYQRPSDLARCLEALKRQERLPDEVLVVVRDTDAATLSLLGAFDWGGVPGRWVNVAKPGLVAARNVALANYRGDIVAFTDDDAVPYPDWLEKIELHFDADRELGGLGGKDRCHNGSGFDDQQARVVGKLQWFGRTIGEHHHGVGAPRGVDFLKGANMSYRQAALVGLRFDDRLRGLSCPCEDLAFSLSVARRGWKLIYDPAVLVDHYPGVTAEIRHYAIVSAVPDTGGLINFGFNQMVTLWDELSPHRRVVYVIWSALVGTRVSPGLLQAIRFTPTLGKLSWKRFLSIQRGSLRGMIAATAPRLRATRASARRTM